MDPSPSRDCGGFRAIRHPPTIALCHLYGATRHNRAAPEEDWGEAQKGASRCYQFSLLWFLPWQDPVQFPFPGVEGVYVIPGFWKVSFAGPSIVEVDRNAK